MSCVQPETTAVMEKKKKKGINTALEKIKRPLPK